MSNQKYEFESYISKANSRGTGYLKIPDKFENEFEIDQHVKVEIENNGDKANFFW